MKLSGIMLNSENPKELADFYTKVLGKPDWEMNGMYGYGGTGNNILIMGHSEVKGKNSMPARMMLSFALADVKKEFERLKGLGAEVVAEPYQPDKEQSPNVWLATVADTDGNYLQLSTPWDSK
jgi:predicted enzyme related to lactoylglutathione lyase